jgi:DedD protein
VDDGAKQRLVGALVLIALGVIFLPVLFSPAHRNSVERQPLELPVAPDSKAIEFVAPQPVERVEPAKPAEQAYQLVEQQEVAEALANSPNGTGEQTATNSKPSTMLDSNGVAQGWVVQVASFKQESRALALRDQLLEQGYPAFTRSHQSGDGVVNRVYVGPKVSQRSAKQLKQKLDESLNVDALILRFSP